MNVKKYIKYIIISICIGCVCFAFIFFLSIYPLKYKHQIVYYANKYNLKPELIASIINTESSFNKNVISPKGAVGLMQILPSTAKWICEMRNIEYNDQYLKIPEFNIDCGCFYFSYLINKFSVEDTAIVAYNAGEGKTKEWLASSKYSLDGKNLLLVPYKETENYLNKIKKTTNIYKIRL